MMVAGRLLTSNPPGDAGAGCAGEVRKSSCHVLQGFREAGAHVPQKRLELLSGFAEAPTARLSSATTQNLERAEAQRNALGEEAG